MNRIFNATSLMFAFAFASGASADPMEWPFEPRPGYPTVQDVCQSVDPRLEHLNTEVVNSHREWKSEVFEAFDKVKPEKGKEKQVIPEWDEQYAKARMFFQFNYNRETKFGLYHTGLCELKKGKKWTPEIRKKIMALCDPRGFKDLKTEYDGLKNRMSNEKYRRVDPALAQEYIRREIAAENSDELAAENEKWLAEKVQKIDEAEFFFWVNVQDSRRPWPDFFDEKQWNQACGPFKNQDAAEIRHVMRRLTGNPKEEFVEGGFKADVKGRPENYPTTFSCISGTSGQAPLVLRRSRINNKKKLVEGFYVFTKDKVYYTASETEPLSANNEITRENPEENLFALGLLGVGQIDEALSSKKSLSPSCMAKTVGPSIQSRVSNGGGVTEGTVKSSN